MDEYHDPSSLEPPAAHRSWRVLWWFLGGIAAATIIGCGGMIAYIGYIGAYGPDTAVYTGNRIPTRFIQTMKEVGALDQDEQILFFYSDAMTDIRDGFYFVSDQRVVIYSTVTDGDPLTLIPFDEIAEVEIYRNESFLMDSEITLTMQDEAILSFPVSSEYDRDQMFFEAIQERVK